MRTEQPLTAFSMPFCNLKNFLKSEEGLNSEGRMLNLFPNLNTASGRNLIFTVGPSE